MSIKSMLRVPTLLAALAIATHPLPAEEVTGEHSVFSEQEVDRISETFGHLITQSLDAPGFSFNIDAIIKGMRGALNHEQPPMNEEEYEAAISAIQEQTFQQLATTNLEEAEVFLAENATHNEVVEIEVGKVQYEIVQSGQGAIVQPHSSPVIHYTGKYLDGSVFGTSLGAGDPVTLPLDQTIPGFSKGIEGMREGEKRTIYIHPEFGYGTSGHLAPNSLLVFEVEVLQHDTSAEHITDSSTFDHSVDEEV